MLILIHLFSPHAAEKSAVFLVAIGKSAKQVFAAEFQKILDHRGEAPMSVLYPLAHLGLARAAALAADVARSRQAYGVFFGLWKDADPDLPVRRAAGHEYDRLKP